MLAEWHITPEYILENWTDEEFSLMIEKLAERNHREAEAYQGRRTSKATVSDDQLFKQAGIKIRKVDHGN